MPFACANKGVDGGPAAAMTGEAVPAHKRIGAHAGAYASCASAATSHSSSLPVSAAIVSGLVI